MPNQYDHDAVQAAKHIDAIALLRRTGLNPGCILDVGCGRGQFTAELGILYPDAVIYGLDKDADFLSEGIKAGNLDKRYVIEGAIQGHKEEYDLVTAIDVLAINYPFDGGSEDINSGAIYYPKVTIQDIARVVSPGGHFLFSEPTRKAIGTKTSYIDHMRNLSEKTHKLNLGIVRHCEIGDLEVGKPYGEVDIAVICQKQEDQ